MGLGWGSSLFIEERRWYWTNHTEYMFLLSCSYNSNIVFFYVFVYTNQYV